MAGVSKSVYNQIPISIDIINQYITFIESGEINSRIVPRWIISEKVDAKAMYGTLLSHLNQLKGVMNQLVEKGMITDPRQELPLGQVSNNEELLYSFYVVFNWIRSMDASGVSTKRMVTTLINEWINFHRDRIGISPIVKAQPNPAFPNDIYFIKYPKSYKKTTGKDGAVKYVPDQTYDLSIADAEIRILEMLKKYPNDNDMIKPTSLEQEAIGLITILSNNPTSAEKTADGVKQEAMKVYINIARQRRVQQLLKKDDNYSSREEVQGDISAVDKELQYLKDLRTQTTRDKVAWGEFMDKYAK